MYTHMCDALKQIEAAASLICLSLSFSLSLSLPPLSLSLPRPLLLWIAGMSALLPDVRSLDALRREQIVCWDNDAAKVSCDLLG